MNLRGETFRLHIGEYKQRKDAPKKNLRTILAQDTIDGTIVLPQKCGKKKHTRTQTNNSHLEQLHHSRAPSRIEIHPACLTAITISTTEQKDCFRNRAVRLLWHRATVSTQSMENDRSTSLSRTCRATKETHTQDTTQIHRRPSFVNITVRH